MKNIKIDDISTSYYITADGRCYNENTQKYLKGNVNKKSGYKRYKLTLPDGKQRCFYAHRLVAEAYIDNPDDKPHVNHIDGDKLNNNVDNLEWVTAKENNIHALKTGLHKAKHVYCFDRNKVLVAEYPSIGIASQASGIEPKTLQAAVQKPVKYLINNFYWSDSQELGETKIYPKTGRKKPVNQYDLNGKFIKSYDSLGEAARALGLKSQNRLGECCRGKRDQYKGFIWKFSDDIVSTSIEK